MEHDDLLHGHIGRCIISFPVSLAQRQRTYQSSTVTNSSLAVDNNANTNFDKGSCSRTQVESSPWFVMELNSPTTVTNLTIITSTDSMYIPSSLFVKYLEFVPWFHF